MAAISAAIACAVTASSLFARPVAGKAAGNRVATTAAVDSDSVAAAFATVMAGFLGPEIEKRWPGDTAAVGEFVRGVANAIDIKNLDTPFFLGVRNGFSLSDRLEAMVELGYPMTQQQFCRALEIALKGSAMGFTEATADQYLRDVMGKLNPVAQPEPLSEKSQMRFIADNLKRPGVEQTASGLLFEIITEGEGAFPTDSDRVKVSYTARLSDGTVFDSTERPVIFPVNNLVPGFTEGLKLMKPGGEYRIIIPPALGYGDQGAAGIIPPGAALDFTIQLLEIMPDAD